MKVYPNPSVNDYVNLMVNPDLLREKNDDTCILLRNHDGKVVYRQSIPTNTFCNKISLNERFNSGMYILELHSPYGKSLEKLVIE